MVTPRSARKLGLWMSIALVVGNMIGSGIFLLPASLAPYGLNSIVGWVLSASGEIALAVVLSRLSRAFADGGGPYAYTHAAFGPLAAFLVAWGYWINVWVGNAAIATGGVSYLAPFFPRIASDTRFSAAVVVFIVWALTAVNCVGVRAAGWVQGITTVLKVLPLVAVAAAGLAAARHRMQGLGTALVEYAHHRALELGLTRMVSIPSVVAMPLYRRLGYRPLRYFSVFQPARDEAPSTE